MGNDIDSGSYACMTMVKVIGHVQGSAVLQAGLGAGGGKQTRTMRVDAVGRQAAAKGARRAKTHTRHSAALGMVGFY